MPVLLKLLVLSYIYKQLFNKSNLIYMIVLIKKAGFKDLVFVIPSVGAIFNIFKTMIFIDFINEIIKMVKYL